MLYKFLFLILALMLTLLSPHQKCFYTVNTAVYPHFYYGLFLSQNTEYFISVQVLRQIIIWYCKTWIAEQERLYEDGFLNFKAECSSRIKCCPGCYFACCYRRTILTGIL